jgi:tetratricopeptide (TPR) repeat protein
LSTALSPWSRPRFSVAPNHLLVGPAVLRVQGVFLWDRTEAEQEGDGEEARKLRAEASEHFLAAAKLNPNDGVPFRFLGHHYARGGDNQRAVKCYHRAVTLNPDDSELRTQHSVEHSISGSVTVGLASKLTCLLRFPLRLRRESRQRVPELVPAPCRERKEKD